MYEAYYGFREKPFSIAPDPAFLYMSAKHRRAASLLEYGIRNQVGFTVITGAIGSGKTTLVRHMLHREVASASVGLVSNTQCETFEELLRWILLAFEREYREKDKVELYQSFTDMLVSEYSEGRRTVVIIDEAQHLGTGSLEQLRMLSNVNADKYQLLQLVLVGQPELWRTLRRPELEQFAQRIGVDYYLEPLSAQETGDYIRHRLRVADGDEHLFADSAVELIWRVTHGVPRVINIICDTALVYGYADQKKRIEGNLVLDVIKDRRQSLLPMRHGDGSADEPPTVADKVRQNG